MSDDPRAVAAKYYEVFSGNPADLDAICAPDMRGHAGAGADLEQLKASIGSFTTSFPDLQTNIKHLVVEGDVVAGWVVYEGTHKEEFAGVQASGSPVKFAGWDLFRVENGKIVELTSHCDLFTILNQIGALPTSTPPDTYSGVEQPTA